MLEELRREIDRIDECLLDAVIERLKVAREIGRVKAQEGLPLTDEEREKELRERWRKRFKTEGLDPALADIVLASILKVSKEVQRGVIGDG
ncbi:chorismate mutase [Methanopyrus kandleri]|uniref:chorismate mutase n=1 Tax=Methanopyrus kandleri TaxID=2320 RepID=UPI001D03801F|nr:chorismate mutase [Methanopyrus kandleri]